ncbi:hypothetical protein FKM82_016270, partial [Ascaphus truei]
LFTSPQIETTPSEIATAGDKITIKCTTDPATLRTNDRLLFAFYKDSQIVQEFSTSGEYHVAGARLQDTGDYTCAVKTQDGKVWKESPNLKISVQPQPVSGVTVQVQPTAGEVIAGQRLEVLCSVDKGTGPFKYSWCNQDTGSCETHQTEAQQHQFIVEPVTEKYDGLYYCSVSRDGTQGARSNSVRISVRVGVSQPLLTLSVDAVAVGDDVGLQCESQRGSFPIHYRFYHKDKGLGDVTANQNGAAQLSVTITSLSMSGDYYCDSRNEVSSTGQRSKEIALSVMEPVANARISTYQEVLEVVAGDTLNLTCSVERGTSPTFLWLHNETEADKSSGLYQISEPGDVLYVRSLQSLHGGRYQCQASNQVSPNSTFSVQSNILNINISGMSPTLRTSLTVSVTVTLLLLILVTAILLFKCRQTIGGVFSKAPVRIAQRPEKKEMLRTSFPTVTPAEDQLEYSNLPARHDTTGEELTYASVDVSRIQKASPAENDGYFVTYSVLKAVERTVDTKAATNIETPDPSDSVYENFNSK